MYQYLTVVELNSFTKAAEKLHMAQPALSIAIKKLEEAIGVALIERKANSFTVSPAGIEFAKHCRICLNHTERAVWSARAIASGGDGALDVAFVSSAAHTVLPKRIPPFLKNHKNLKINLIESTSRDIMRMLLDAKIDIGFLRGPLEFPEDIEAIDLGRDEFVLMVENTHPLLNCLHVTPEALCTESFVMYAANSPLRNSALSFCQDNNFTPVIAQEAIEIQTVAAMVGCGLGVALVPRTVVPSIGGPVQFLTLDRFSHKMTTGVYMARRKGQGSPLINDFFRI